MKGRDTDRDRRETKESTFTSDLEEGREVQNKKRRNEGRKRQRTETGEGKGTVLFCEKQCEKETEENRDED